MAYSGPHLFLCHKYFMEMTNIKYFGTKLLKVQNTASEINMSTNYMAYSESHLLPCH